MTPLIVGQPMNRAVLLDYASQYLVPALQGGDIVRCLRVSSRKDTETAQIIAHKGATSRFLSRYSPGLNPIEMAISKAKNRSGRWDRIGHRVDLFPPDECRNRLRYAEGTPTGSPAAIKIHFGSKAYKL